MTEGWQAFYYRSRYYVLLEVEWSAQGGQLLGILGTWYNKMGNIRWYWVLGTIRWRVESETPPSATHSESITSEPPGRCYTLLERSHYFIDSYEAVPKTPFPSFIFLTSVEA